MNETLDCPKCGNELRKGYIFSSRRICWSESGESILFDDGNEVLIKDSIFKIAKIPAYRCEVCKFVTFSYN
jgi:hypothetical protein